MEDENPSIQTKEEIPSGLMKVTGNKIAPINAEMPIVVVHEEATDT